MNGEHLPTRPIPPPRQLAKRHCVGFGRHAAAISTIIPGRAYLMVAVCRQGNPGYADELIISSLVEAPGLEKHLPKEKSAPGGAAADGVVYERDCDD